MEIEVERFAKKSMDIKMSKIFEIAENPKILIDKDFDSNLLSIEGLKLNDDYRKIDLLDIVEVYIRNYSNPYANFTERLEQLKNHDGFIHMAGRFGFGIKNQRITEIIFRGKYIDELKRYDEPAIVDFCGKPNKVLTDSITWVFDYVEYAKILVFSDRRLYFFIDTETKKVSEIRIGDVDEKFFM